MKRTIKTGLVVLAAVTGLFVSISQADQILPQGAFIHSSLWEGVDASPSVDTGQDSGGMPQVIFPCPFPALKGWRYAWDLPLDVDLKQATRLRLQLRADDPEAIIGMIVYFQSGKGWYGQSFGPPGKAWSDIVVRKHGFKPEGEPAGWNQVNRVRIAVLPAFAKKETKLYLRGIDTSSGLTAEDIFRVGPYMSYEAMQKDLSGTAQPMDLLAQAQAIGKSLDDKRGLSQDEKDTLIHQGRDLAVQAYALAQKPVAGEIRGFWCHNGAGPDMGWTKAIEALSKNGFNTLFPNMLWSGMAYYPSKVLPMAPDVADGTHDYLQECIDAGRKNGVAIHVWKVCWQFGWMSDPKAATPFRFSGRMQVDKTGKQGEWLCPSNKKNRKYEMDAIMEVVKNYDIDGFHLDYIRYNDDDWCFCQTCRRNFEAKIGHAVKSWPDDVVEPDGKLAEQYKKWRRDNITSFVAEVRKNIRKAKPKVQLSAAVFSDPDNAENHVLQDWPRWAQEGLVDFLCPMNYTSDANQFRAWVAEQKKTLAGRIPFYPGIYVVSEDKEDRAPDVALAQIAVARELGVNGFTIFQLEDQVVKDLLPVLSKGATKQ